jgi:hypothetical protein
VDTNRILISAGIWLSPLAKNKAGLGFNGWKLYTKNHKWDDWHPKICGEFN